MKKSGVEKVEVAKKMVRGIDEKENRADKKRQGENSPESKKPINPNTTRLKKPPQQWGGEKKSGVWKLRIDK